MSKHAWPYKTKDELRAAGYVYTNTRKCAGKTCGMQIETWLTPNKATMVLNVSDLQPHFAVCPDLQQFRYPKPKAKS